MLQALLSYIRKQDLIRAGDRVGVAVSGGADSVALLRALLELRQELGIVLSVIHLNHGIRGPESNADAAFVAHLARQYELPMHRAAGDVPAYAKTEGLSLEAAARKLRYALFRTVLNEGSADKIATAHTRDDQAETVLLRLLRGAGTRGLSGIHPALKYAKGSIVRPMLEISRAQVEAYLKSLGQEWREDSTNRDTAYLRNRVRHSLLPLLERDYNPNIRQLLSESAEVARDEETFWTALTDRMTEDAVEQSDDKVTVRLAGATGEARALQRRMLRLAAERVGLALDFHHVEQVLGLLELAKGSEIELPDRWRARRLGKDSITLEQVEEAPVVSGYEYAMTIPGEIRVEAVGTLVRLTIVRRDEGREMYNPASLLEVSKIANPLVLRSWRPGDRMRPLHRGSEEKLKRLFQEKKIPAEERPLWPVMLSKDKVVWAKGLGVAADFAAQNQAAEAVFVETVDLSS